MPNVHGQREQMPPEGTDERAARLARVDALVDAMAERVDPETAADPTAFLYDARTGLPRSPGELPRAVTGVTGRIA